MDRLGEFFSNMVCQEVCQNSSVDHREDSCTNSLLEFFLKATQKRMDFFNDISVSRIGSMPTFFLVQV